MERHPAPHMALVMESRGKGMQIAVLSRCSSVACYFYAKAPLNGNFKTNFTLKLFLIFQDGLGFSIREVHILCNCSWSGCVAHFNTCKEARNSFTLLFLSLIGIRDGSSYWSLGSGSALAVNPSGIGAFGIWCPAFTHSLRNETAV